MTRPLYSIVLPCHNEAAHVGALLRNVERAFAGTAYECLVIADGCTDDTARVVADVARTMPAVTLYDQPKRLGKGGAIRRGMLEARGRYAGFVDGDGEIDAIFLRTALDRLVSNPDTDIVVGSRYADEGAYRTGLLRRITSRAYRKMIDVLFGLNIRDTQAGLKAFTIDAARHLFSQTVVDGFAFDIDILAHAHRLAYTVTEIPIVQHFKGTSSMNANAIASMLIDTLRVYGKHISALVRQSIVRT